VNSKRDPLQEGGCRPPTVSGQRLAANINWPYGIHMVTSGRQPLELLRIAT